MTTKRDSGSSGPTADLPPPPAKRTKTTKRQEPLALDASWSDLRPELVASVAKFVDIGSDLTNLCIVAGPVVSAVIRKTYLHDNDDFLRYALGLRWKDERRLNIIRSWMEVNADWSKKYVRTGAKVGAAGAGAVIAIKVAPADALAMRFKRGLGKSIVYTGRDDQGEGNGTIDRLPSDELMRLGSGIVYTGRSDEDFGDGVDTVQEGDVLVSVENMRVGPDTSFHAVKSLIASDFIFRREVVLRFIRSGKDLIFKDPVVSIDIGLIDVLGVILERDSVDVNGLFALQETGGAHSLLWYSLVRAPDSSVLTYLLSRNDIDCSADCHSGIPGRNILRDICVPGTSIEKFSAVVRHRTVDVNTASFQGMTPLLHFCSDRNSLDRVHRSLSIAKLKIFLEAGADPNSEDNNGRSSIDVLRAFGSNNTLSAEARECALEMLALAENARSG